MLLTTEPDLREGVCLFEGRVLLCSPTSLEPTEILFLPPECWDSRLYASVSSIAFIFIVWTHVYYVCMPTLCVDVPWSWSYRWLRPRCGQLVLNCSPLEEQQVLVNSEKSLLSI